MKDKTCPHCGYLLQDFYNSGLLGCPKCYYAFGAEILSAIKKVQGATTHVGKTPSVTDAEIELVNEYQRLLSEKENAVISGKFSQINSVSKELFALKEELEKRGLI